MELEYTLNRICIDYVEYVQKLSVNRLDSLQRVKIDLQNCFRDAEIDQS